MAVHFATKLLTPAETAERIGLQTPDTLAIWRCKGRYLLPWVYVGRLVRYREEDVAKFVESRVTTQTRPHPVKAVSPGRPRKQRKARKV